jgi:hypothetical protein
LTHKSRNRFSGFIIMLLLMISLFLTCSMFQNGAFSTGHTQLTQDSYCNSIDSFHDKYCTSSYYSRAIMTRCEMDTA